MRAILRASFVVRRKAAPTSAACFCASFTCRAFAFVGDLFFVGVTLHACCNAACKLIEVGANVRLGATPLRLDLDNLID